MLRVLIDPLLSVLYPQRCHVCGGAVEKLSDGVACAECWEATRLFGNDEALCVKCGAPLADQMESCQQCVELEFDRALSIGIYERALAATVVQLKNLPYVAKKTGGLFRDLFEKLDLNDRPVLIPIPLSKRRKFERGHNQAEVLANMAASATGLSVIGTCLVRTTHTPIHRVAMDKKAREITVRNAFDVRSPRLIEGCNVILIDDVMTSGSTASACAKVLKKRDAGRVTVVTLARAVM